MPRQITSDYFINKLPEWEQKQLKLFWLSPYSPQHNLIEILWRFLKHEWIEINAYIAKVSIICPIARCLLPIVQ
jgi:transposase